MAENQVLFYNPHSFTDDDLRRIRKDIFWQKLRILGSASIIGLSVYLTRRGVPPVIQAKINYLNLSELTYPQVFGALFGFTALGKSTPP